MAWKSSLISLEHASGTFPQFKCNSARGKPPRSEVQTEVTSIRDQPTQTFSLFLPTTIVFAFQPMDEKNPDSGSGSGQHLPRAVLALATLSAVFATVLSFHTIILQLKNYRKLSLQRFTVRILVM
jgi:hypothetical protein